MYEASKAHLVSYFESFIEVYLKYNQILLIMKQKKVVDTFRHLSPKAFLSCNSKFTKYDIQIKLQILGF